MTEHLPALAVGAVVMKDEALLLIERDQPPAEGSWVVPGGRVERGESLRDAAAREVFEETGLTVAVGEVAWNGVIGTDPRFAVVDFHAEVTGGSMRAATDARSVRWIPMAEARTMDLTPSMRELLDLLGGTNG